MDLPKGARLQPDGTIILSARGVPPDCNLPGYEEDPQDPYRWNLIWLPCKHRNNSKQIRCPSGRIGTHVYCELLQLKLARKICFDCIRREEV